MPIDLYLVNKQAQSLLPLYATRSPRSGTLHLIQSYQEPIQKMLALMAVLLLENNTAITGNSKTTDLKQNAECYFEIAVLLSAAEESHNSCSKILLEKFYQFLQVSGNLSLDSRTVVSEGNQLKKQAELYKVALVFQDAYRHYYHDIHRKHQNTQKFVISLSTAVQNLTRSGWIAPECANNDVNLLASLALFKFFRKSRQFECLPKINLFDFSYFQNRVEQHTILQLHYDVSHLTSSEYKIILAYLCKGRAALKFSTISKEIQKQDDPKDSTSLQAMPNEYLENCLIRIAEAIRAVSREYIKLPAQETQHAHEANNSKNSENTQNSNILDLVQNPMPAIIGHSKTPHGTEVRENGKNGFCNIT